jgi:transposase
VSTPPDAVPDDLETLKAAFLAERAARLEAEARASGAEAMVAHLKLLIAKLKRERFGPSSEHRRRLLDQLELHSRSWRRPRPRTPMPPKWPPPP